MMSRAEEFLGAKVKDQLTGLAGYCVGYTQYLYGCNHVIVEAVIKADGELSKMHAFDEQRILIEEPPAALLDKAPRTNAPGGPRIDMDRC